MNTYTGTRPLTRLALRQDRVRLSVWVLVIGLLPAVTAAQYKQLYPNPQSLDQVSGVVSNTSLVALNGPLFGKDSIGALSAWKVGITEFILIAIMAILTVVRHTRAEEETGRYELVGSGVVGRHAPLTAGLMTAGIGSIGSGLLAMLGLLGAEQATAGSVAFGLAIAVTGLVFAAVAAVAAQLTETARSATALSAAVLAAFYLVRAIGDTGPTAVSYAGPIGWAMRVRAYAGEQWGLLLPSVALAVALTVVAYALVARRDLGAGMLPQRPGPAAAAPSLASAFGLAWRLHRGLLIGWIVGMAVAGAVFGGSAKAIGDANITNSDMTKVLARMGGTTGLLNAYLGAVLGITGITVAVYTVQATLRLRGEETAGRLEPLLATRTGRIRWAIGHLTFAVLGTLVLLAVAGLFAGLAYGAQIHDVGHQAGRLTLAALAQTPAAWVLAGFGAALFGLIPRLSALTWAALVACLVVLEVGEVLGLSQRVLDVSPFAHVPKLPGATFTITPLVWLTLVAVVLAGTGLTAFRRRDIG